METKNKNHDAELPGNAGIDSASAAWLKHLWYIISGSAVTAIWLALFVAGLMVNSAYYRTAVNYGFADLKDWICVILTFTVSNVAILAFFSGLLGGIISKLRATEGFTIDEKLAAMKKSGRDDKSIQVENPFISAVRGMFVFIAILFMQYISSFNDLGSIGRNGSQQQQEVNVDYDQLYKKLAEPLNTDTLLRKEMQRVLKEAVASDAASRTDDAIVKEIFLLKEDLKQKRKLKGNEGADSEIRIIESELKSLRRTLKPPPDADFSQIGISSFSYFKFAVIVSFLAFIFGYDASRFAAFLGRMPFFKSADKAPGGDERN